MATPSEDIESKRKTKCPDHVLQAIYGKVPNKTEAYDKSLHRLMNAPIHNRLATAVVPLHVDCIVLSLPQQKKALHCHFVYIADWTWDLVYSRSYVPICGSPIIEVSIQVGLVKLIPFLSPTFISG